MRKPWSDSPLPVMGVVLDYVSQDILRRWTKDLGIANFSYHVPGVNALRLWPTAVVHARAGKCLRPDGMAQNWFRGQSNYCLVSTETFDDGRERDPSGYLSTKSARGFAGASAYPMEYFERALLQILSGEGEDSVPFRVNLDAAQYGTVPPSEAPLRLQTGRGIRTFFAMSIIPKRTP